MMSLMHPQRAWFACGRGGGSGGFYAISANFLWQACGRLGGRGRLHRGWRRKVYAKEYRRCIQVRVQVSYELPIFMVLLFYVDTPLEWSIHRLWRLLKSANTQFHAHPNVPFALLFLWTNTQTEPVNDEFWFSVSIEASKNFKFNILQNKASQIFNSFAVIQKVLIWLSDFKVLQKNFQSRDTIALNFP